MKLKYFVILFFITSTILFYYSFSGGIVGVTRKNGNGCVCHGIGLSSEVNVTIFGPDTIISNDTSEFLVQLSGGPLIRGGTNIAVRRGVLLPGSGLRMSNGELTHISPFEPQNNVIKFSFKYVAPSTEGADTIYANGNSVNFDGFTTGDKWNFAQEKKIVILSSTGIKNHDSPAESFVLYQNFPNPFNPNTIIKYQIKKSGAVKLRIFDTAGKVIAILTDQKQNPGNYTVKFNGENFPSGIYFYKLEESGLFETRKMMLIK